MVMVGVAIITAVRIIGIDMSNLRILLTYWNEFAFSLMLILGGRYLSVGVV